MDPHEVCGKTVFLISVRGIGPDCGPEGFRLGHSSATLFLKYSHVLCFYQGTPSKAQHCRM